MLAAVQRLPGSGGPSAVRAAARGTAGQGWDRTGHLPHFQPGWPAGAGGASATAHDDILHPVDIAALAFGERRGLPGSRCWAWGGRECGAVRSHLSARSSPGKGHSPSLAFVADL